MLAFCLEQQLSLCRPWSHDNGKMMYVIVVTFSKEELILCELRLNESVVLYELFELSICSLIKTVLLPPVGINM